MCRLTLARFFEMTRLRRPWTTGRTCALSPPRRCLHYPPTAVLVDRILPARYAKFGVLSFVDARFIRIQRLGSGVLACLPQGRASAARCIFVSSTYKGAP